MPEALNLVVYPFAGAQRLRDASKRAISSGGEHYLDTVGVRSSNLLSPTIDIEGAFTDRRLLFVFRQVGYRRLCRSDSLDAADVERKLLRRFDAGLVRTRVRLSAF